MSVLFGLIPLDNPVFVASNIFVLFMNVVWTSAPWNLSVNGGQGMVDLLTHKEDFSKIAPKKFVEVV